MHVIGLENGKRRVDSGVLRKIISIVISEVKNDRPVTLLPACDKVFEKLLSQQVTAFIEPRLSWNLTAYRKRHSTETSLINLTENWKRAIDDRHIVGILSTDMSKAFDSLHPPLFLRKLNAYGFSTSSTGLIRFYFTEENTEWKLAQRLQVNGRRCQGVALKAKHLALYFGTRFKTILTSLQMNTT